MDDALPPTTALLDAIDDAAVIGVALTGAVTFWNRSAEELFEWTREEALGRAVSDLVISDVDRSASLEASQAARGGVTWTGNLVVRRRDGSSFLSLVRIFPVREAGGEVTGLLVFAADTTEAYANDQVAVETERLLGDEPGAVPAVVAVVRPAADGQVDWLYSNEGWNALFGDRQIPRERPLYHADDLAPGDIASVREVVLSGHSVGRDVRIRDQSGSYRWFRFRLVPGSARPGAVNVVTIVGIDIDAQRMAQRAAEQRSSVLRRLADAVPALITVSVPSPQGSRVVFTNRRWQDYSGLPAEVLADHEARSAIYHPDDRDRISSIVRGASAPRRYDGNFRFRRADGEYRWHHVVHESVTDPSSGDVVAYVTVGMDVHESHEGQQVRARLAAIVDGSADAIVGKSLDGVITSWNRGAERLYGFTAEEVVGKSVDIYIPEERRDEIHDLYRRLGEGESFPPFETERLTRDGRRIPVSLTVSPVVGQDGQITGAAAIARDITEEKRMVDALRRANAIKEEFLSLVSHEMRTPLTTVVGLAHVLARRADRYDEETREIHLDLFRESGRLQAIIENMLMLTRLDSEPVGLDPVLPGRLVERVASRFQERRPSSSLHTQVQERLPLVAGQEGWLEQIIENLLSNAEKYSPAGSPITLSAEREGDTVILCVRDHGPGIAEEDRPYVFEAFFRSRSTSGVPGAGLGLAVCKRLAELQDGEIEALPAEGGGTRMVLRLKLADGRVD